MYDKQFGFRVGYNTPTGRVDGRAEGVCVVKAKAGPSCPEGQCFQYSLSR